MTWVVSQDINQELSIRLTHTHARVRVHVRMSYNSFFNFHSRRHYTLRPIGYIHRTSLKDPSILIPVTDSLEKETTFSDKEINLYPLLLWCRVLFTRLVSFVPYTFLGRINDPRSTISHLYIVNVLESGLTWNSKIFRFHGQRTIQELLRILWYPVYSLSYYSQIM